MTTDTASGAAAPAPKKRSFFKKAAWQTTTPKVEGEKEQDMFSHSHDFRDLIAEESKRKNAERLEVERQKAEEVRLKAEKELGKKKKRKLSIDMEEDIYRSGESRRSRMGSKGRSKTPLSPTRRTPADSLAQRYDSLIKSSSDNSLLQTQHIIDLGSSEDDDDDTYPTQQFKPSPNPTQHIPIRPVWTAAERGNSPEIEEGEDPVLVQLRARARQREAEKAAAKAAAQQKTTTTTSASQEEEKTKAPCVELLLASHLPQTIPMRIKVRLDTTLDMPKQAWCERQGFTATETQDMILTFKMRQIYSSTRVERLGLTDKGNGCVMMEGDDTIYDEENLARPVVELWTSELFQEHKFIDAAERKAAEPVAPVYKDPTPEPVPDAQSNIRLFLKAKDKKEVRITVRKVCVPE
jgi:hypothetical protein